MKVLRDIRAPLANVTDWTFENIKLRLFTIVKITKKQIGMSM